SNSGMLLCSANGSAKTARPSHGASAPMSALASDLMRPGSRSQKMSEQQPVLHDGRSVDPDYVLVVQWVHVFEREAFRELASKAGLRFLLDDYGYDSPRMNEDGGTDIWAHRDDRENCVALLKGVPAHGDPSRSVADRLEKRS